MDSRFRFEVMRGERGLLSVEDRAAAATSVEGGIRDELGALAAFLEARAERTENLYSDIGLDGETETRCLRAVADALRARAQGGTP